MLITIPLLLCWGSFLNLVAHRLVTNKPLFSTRFFCPKCNANLIWYDTIPLFSWIFLRRKCRHCNQSISLLYPLIEVFTLAVLLTLTHLSQQYQISYFVFFSALIVSIRSDLETMLISRFVTLFLIPLGFLFAWAEILPITLFDSVIGAILGYGILYIASKIFFWLTKKEGIGQGDLELLAFIGSFVGSIGCWISLFIGAIVGSIGGVIYITLSGESKEVRIPFGPFLALGAIIYVLFQEKLLLLIFPGL